MDKSLVIHVGPGKTGSSSLQHYLSFNGTHSSADRCFVYGAILANSQILVGKKLSEAAERSPLKHISSCPDVCGTIDFSRLRAHLETLWAEGYTPILSQEDWCRRVLDFERRRFFEELGAAPKVVMIIRPQIDWFNSGWWQWWAWDPRFHQPKDVLDLWGHNIYLWNNMARIWRRYVGPENVHIRLHTKDVISDFLEFLGVSVQKPCAAPVSVNKSLGPRGIKLLKLLGDLRGPHNSALDALISTYLPEKESAPWAISGDLASKIIEACSDGNREIAEMLSPELRLEMLADERWWSAEYCQGRPVWKEEDETMSYEDIKFVLRELLINLLKK